MATPAPQTEVQGMMNINTLALVGTLAVVGFTGCQTSTRTSERSEGRMVDDHKITSNIKADLNTEPVYKFNDVSVKTFNGVVQLSGFVNTQEQKSKAAEIAQHVPGVVEVQNAISLKPQVPAPTGRTSEVRINDSRVNDPNAPANRR
jgi:hypothetical protein